MSAWHHAVRRCGVVVGWYGHRSGRDLQPQQQDTTPLFLPIALRAQLVGRQLELRFSQLATSCVLLVCGAVIGQLAHVVAGKSRPVMHTSRCSQCAAHDRSVPLEGPGLCVGKRCSTDTSRSSGTSATWTPAAWFHYVANCRCSTASQLDFGSPLWAGRTIPGYGFFYYMTMVAPPMLASGRLPELIFILATLAAAFTYQETWGSKWCAFGCLLSIWYLAYPGPPLPPHACAYQHAPPAYTPNRVHGMSGGKRLTSESDSEPAVWAPVRGLVPAYERFSFSTARP
ncbi:hypothetical protein JKP88DRAFT_244644 [Tribonema minus]|uniref:Uncharacterized protein n=1 Tax=Tribonema minus TaxID=303371 RepID=A0A836CGR3_9STRA|nr:hypothetical protein JKP88DRAFT_244644 [Tribonema minus]